MELRHSSWDGLRQGSVPENQPPGCCATQGGTQLLVKVRICVSRSLASSQSVGFRVAFLVTLQKSQHFSLVNLTSAGLSAHGWCTLVSNWLSSRGIPPGCVLGSHAKDCFQCIYLISPVAGVALRSKVMPTRNNPVKPVLGLDLAHMSIKGTSCMVLLYDSSWLCPLQARR